MAGSRLIKVGGGGGRMRDMEMHCDGKEHLGGGHSYLQMGWEHTAIAQGV